MENQKKYRIDVDVDDVRLDKFLSSSLSEFSRSLIQRSIKSNLVFVGPLSVRSSAHRAVPELRIELPESLQHARGREIGFKA